jgi:hypothetical protein
MAYTNDIAGQVIDAPRKGLWQLQSQMLQHVKFPEVSGSNMCTDCMCHKAISTKKAGIPLSSSAVLCTQKAWLHKRLADYTGDHQLARTHSQV